jgi:hypothetical protein
MMISIIKDPIKTRKELASSSSPSSLGPVVRTEATSLHAPAEHFQRNWGARACLGCDVSTCMKSGEIFLGLHHLQLTGSPFQHSLYPQHNYSRNRSHDKSKKLHKYHEVNPEDFHRIGRQQAQVARPQSKTRDAIELNTQYRKESIMI